MDLTLVYDLIMGAFNIRIWNLTIVTYVLIFLTMFIVTRNYIEWLFLGIPIVVILDSIGIPISYKALLYTVFGIFGVISAIAQPNAIKELRFRERSIDKRIAKGKKRYQMQKYGVKQPRRIFKIPSFLKRSSKSSIPDASEQITQMQRFIREK